MFDTPEHWSMFSSKLSSRNLAILGPLPLQGLPAVAGRKHCLVLLLPCVAIGTEPVNIYECFLAVQNLHPFPSSYVSCCDKNLLQDLREML